MSIETLDVFGIMFVSHAMLAYGDYDNSCEIERGNVAYVLDQTEEVAQARMSDIRTTDKADHYAMTSYAVEDYCTNDSHGWTESTKKKEMYKQCDVIHTIGGYNSHQVWIRQDLAEKWQTIENLENYPELDDSYTTIVRMKLEDEYILEILTPDLVRDTQKWLENDLDDWETDTDSLPFDEWIQQAMAYYNVYIQIEAGANCYIPKDDYNYILMFIKNKIEENA